MKSFFEEYGFVILAAIVVILLIAMATPIGDLVKAQITGIVDSFANKTESKLNAVDAGAIMVRVTENKKQANGTGTIKLSWDAEKKEDKFTAKTRVTDSTAEASWVDVAAITGQETGEAGFKNTARDFSVTGLKNGAKVEYKIYDSNGVVVASGTVVARV